jgi:hypothetical protein
MGVYRGDAMKPAERARTTHIRMPRSRGAVSGLLLVILGAWGALIPFIGPRFNFAYTPDQQWVWTTARGWLEVLPGGAAVLGGLLLLVSRHRAIAIFGGWLAVLAGAWFVVGGQVAPLLGIGSVGDPIAATDRKRALLEVSYFTGLGALIVFVGGLALARVAARLARDVEPFEPAPAPAESEAPLEYVSAVDRGSPEVPSGAITTPRVEHFPPPASETGRHFRRQREGAAASSANAAYLRWPHPQS